MADTTQLEPASAHVQARIRNSFDRQPLMRHLGASLGLIAPGRVHIELPSRPEILQQHGFVHAGATCAIAASAGEYAALTLLDGDGADLLGIEYKVNFLAPAKGDYLEAIGTVMKFGRTLSVCSFEVFGVLAAKRIMVAAGQQTLIRVEAK
jgi:uncharacterized protein (TIGR00369 family)